MKSSHYLRQLWRSIDFKQKLMIFSLNNRLDFVARLHFYISQLLVYLIHTLDHFFHMIDKKLKRRWSDKL